MVLMPAGLREKLKLLDPFTYVDRYVMPVVNPSGNPAIELVVDVFFAFVFAFVIYNFVLAFLLGTSTPLVIVYSGSMEPVLYRGDVVVLQGSSVLDIDELEVDFPVGGRNIYEYASIGYSSYPFPRAAALRINGSQYLLDRDGPIVVYYSTLRGQDIIHRAVLRLRAPDGNFIITFGDNNARIDQDCREVSECISSYPIPEGDLKGKYVFHIPLLGYVKLLIFDELPRLLK